MSATNRGAERIDSDEYETPEPTVRAILERVHWPLVREIFEPCVASGKILYHPIIPMEVDRQAYEIKMDLDYMEYKHVGRRPHDLVVTNPPLTLWREFLERSLSHAHTVCYLLPLPRLGSGVKERRAEFWNANPPTYLFPLEARPRFVVTCSNRAPKKGGCKVMAKVERAGESCPECGGTLLATSDATDYAWFVWDGLGVIRGPRRGWLEVL